MLGVSPNTLRSWERRFGFPEPKRTAGGHRQFDLAEIEALRAAFEETQNVSSASRSPASAAPGPATPRPAAVGLRAASTRTAPTASDRGEPRRSARSSARSRRSCCPPVERSPDEAPTPEHGFAWRWTRPAGWPPRSASRRRPSRAEGVLVFDASRAPGRRRAARPGAGARRCAAPACATLTLTVAPGSRPPGRTRSPRWTRASVVLTGRRASLDALGRLVFAARRVGGEDVDGPRLPRRAPATRAPRRSSAARQPLAARDAHRSARRSRRRRRSAAPRPPSAQLRSQRS